MHIKELIWLEGGNEYKEGRCGRGKTKTIWQAIRQAVVAEVAAAAAAAAAIVAVVKLLNRSQSCNCEIVCTHSCTCRVVLSYLNIM